MAVYLVGGVSVEDRADLLYQLKSKGIKVINPVKRSFSPEDNLDEVLQKELKIAEKADSYYILGRETSLEEKLIERFKARKIKLVILNK